jgi:hypothetical protein
MPSLSTAVTRFQNCRFSFRLCSASPRATVWCSRARKSSLKNAFTATWMPKNV